MNISYKVKILTFFSFVFIVAKIYTSQHIFFWDTIQLGSKHAYFFFENGLKFSLLPDSVDSGHIPVFGYYLAVVWKIFGKTLFVSHLSMLPFIVGIIFQLYLLTKRVVSDKYVPWVLVFILSDPSLLSQLLIISPDILLVFFYLLTINASISGKQTNKIIGTLGLCATSMRGMFALTSIFLVDLLNLLSREKRKVKFKNLLTLILPYLPGFLLGILFFAWHYLEKGWFGYHGDSPWASSFEITKLREVFYNLFIVSWRLADFGRIFLWVFVFSSSVFFYKSGMFKNKKVLLVSKYFIAFFNVNLPVWLFFKSLTMHRYMLVAFLLIALIVSIIIHEYYKKHRKIIFISLILLLMSGNLWVYPDKISMGWDATLAHLPYYKLRDDMLSYMKENNIKINGTGSAFPNLAETKYLNPAELNNQVFLPFNLENNKYIFQSNVYNDFSDQQLEVLEKEWELVKEFKKLKVYIRLYKNPKYE